MRPRETPIGPVGHPEQLACLPWPQEPASGCLKDGAFAPVNCRHHRHFGTDLMVAGWCWLLGCVLYLGWAVLGWVDAPGDGTKVCEVVAALIFLWGCVLMVRNSCGRGLKAPSTLPDDRQPVAPRAQIAPTRPRTHFSRLGACRGLGSSPQSLRRPSLSHPTGTRPRCWLSWPP
jgi:hypothetical protein